MDKIVGPGDFNGDGNHDVIAADPAGALWLYPGNGRAGWLPRVQVGSGWDYMTGVVGPGDFNSNFPPDGTADLPPATRTASSGTTPVTAGAVGCPDSQWGGAGVS